MSRTARPLKKSTDSPNDQRESDLQENYELATPTTTQSPARDADPGSDDIVPGTQLGEYVLGALIGAGGCGVVYRAKHRVLGRPAAVKVLHRSLVQSEEMVERFVRETRAANLIGHPNIIDIWDFGRHAGRPYFVMELLEGMSLSDLLRRGTLSPAEALEVLEPVCAAVEAAHRVGIVHRDLKASNIAVSGSGTERRIKLLDFGIAKLTQADGDSTALTAIGRKLGTPTSMAPEQILGRAVDRRTDIYALGVLLFHMLTGRYPFEAAEPLEIERMHLEQAPRRPSEYVALGASVEAVILRCLEKVPDRRFDSVGAFLSALREAVDESRRRSATSAAARRETAAAVLIEVVLSDEAQETMDEMTLDDLMNALEAAQKMLIEAGLRVSLQTGSAVLGIVSLPPTIAEQEQARANVVEKATALYRALDRRPGKQPGVFVTVCAHVDHALLRTTGSDSDEEITGPVISIGRWMPQQKGGGLYVTPEMVEGLDIPTEKVSRTHRRVVLGG